MLCCTIFAVSLKELHYKDIVTHNLSISVNHHITFDLSSILFIIFIFCFMNIFVAKLSPYTTGEGLQNLFEQFGAVTSAKVIMDRETGFSKRFGFVEMENDNEAYEAIEALNDSEFEGNQIVVKKARPRQPRAPRQDNWRR